MKVLIPPIYEREDIDLALDEYDIFQRKKFINNLTTLFKNTSDGLVISVDSQWGDGKTTLIKQWKKQLTTAEQFIPIYYDAFKNDFTEDPFLSIAVEIHEALDAELEKSGVDTKNKAQLKELKKHTVAISAGLIKMFTRTAVTSLSGGLLDSKKNSDHIGTSIENLLFSTIEYDANEKFKAHLTIRKNIEDYQKHLKKMLTIGEGKKHKKIIFFIDELDRCRPIFAIEVIEKIKHLFSIDNVFFVLAVNKRQLTEIIKHNYGMQEGDAENYLQKFIHIETKLPPLDMVTKGRDNLHVKIRKFVDHLVEQHELSGFFEHKLEAKRSIIHLLATFENPLVTPRAIERVLSLVAIAIGSSEGKVHNDLNALTTLCNMAVLKICAPELYDRWKRGEFIDEKADDLESKVFEQLEKNFPFREKNKQLTNKFKVDKTDYVCGILDIYTFYKMVTSSTDISWNG